METKEKTLNKVYNKCLKEGIIHTVLEANSIHLHIHTKKIYMQKKIQACSCHRYRIYIHACKIEI